MNWRRLGKIALGVAAVLAFDAMEWSLYHKPVVMWRSAVPVEFLLIAFVPRLAHRLHLTREQMFRDNTVLYAVLCFAVYGLAYASEFVLPQVSPPIAAVIWGVSSVLFCLAATRRAVAEVMKTPRAVSAAIATSQTTFATGALFALRRPDLAGGMAALTVLCAVICVLLAWSDTRPDRPVHRYERVLARRGTPTNE